MPILFQAVIRHWLIANLSSQSSQYLPAGSIDGIYPNFLDDKIIRPDVPDWVGLLTHYLLLVPFVLQFIINK